MSKPREWYIPAAVGGFYDGKEVHFAVGPKVDGVLPNPGGIYVVERNVYLQLKAQADALADALEDYINHDPEPGYYLKILESWKRFKQGEEK